MHNRSEPWIKRIFRGKNALILVITAIVFIFLNVYRMNDPLPIGTQAIDFKLTSAEGRELMLSDIGKPVVMVFYKKDAFFSNLMFNNTYKKLMPQLKFLQDKNLAQLVVIVDGYDKFEKMARLAEDKDHQVLKNTGYATDTDKIADYFGVRSWPHIFVLNSDRVVIFESKLAGAEYIQKILWRN